jgi:hypothetical protein
MRLRIAFHRGTTFQRGDDAHALRKLSRYGNGVPRWSRPAVLRRVCGKALSFFGLNHPKGSFSPLAGKTASTAMGNTRRDTKTS